MYISLAKLISKAVTTFLAKDSFPKVIEQSAGGKERIDITTITIPVVKKGM